MKILEIMPRLLNGKIEIPPSKSVSHRAIISAALAKGESKIQNVLMSQDMIATCKAMESLGALIDYQEEADHRFTLTIDGRATVTLKNNQIDCKESGSTLRFLIPLLLLQDQAVTITGQGRLVTRPLKPYYDIFDEKEISYKHLKNDCDLPLSLAGKLRPGRYQIDGNVSSQFITGLMFALPLLKGDSQICLNGPLESKPYIDITIDVLKDFGIAITIDNNQNYYIKGNQSYQTCDYRIEGDFSQAAFYLVAGTIGQKLLSKDIKLTSHQGDKVIVEIIKKMGGIIEQSDQGLLAKPAKTKGIVIDVSQCPDLLPVLGVLASMSQGESRMIKGQRLRFKESDRLKTTAALINQLGGKAIETADGLIIHGITKFRGGRVESDNDHRIAMAAAIASIASDSPVILEGADAVNKSYPHFWDDFKSLGGVTHELSLGQ